MKKQLIAILIMILALSCLFSACAGTSDDTVLKSIQITGKPTAEVYEDSDPITLGYKTDPETAEVAVEWSSSVVSVAEIDASGKITVKGTGSTEITLQVKDSTIKDSFTLQVKEKPVERVPVTAIAITGKPTKECIVGQALELGYAFEPQNADAFEVEWISSNTQVATVSSQGKAEIVGEGKTIITLQVKGTEVSDSFELTALPASKPVETLEITNIPDGALYSDAQDFQLSYTYLPADADVFAVVWDSSDKSVAMVDENGNVTVKGIGSTEISATVYGTQIKDSFTLVITKAPNPVTAVTIINKPEGKIFVNTENFTLSTSVVPEEDPDEYTLVWTSSDPEIATVADGTVDVLKEGTVTITVSVEGNESIKDEFTFTVYSVLPQVESISIINKPEESVSGEGIQLEYSASPEETMPFEVKWTSSDPAVAQINETGYVTFIKSGTVNIKLEVEGTSISDNFDLTIVNPVKTIQITEIPTADVLEGESPFTLGHTVSGVMEGVAPDSYEVAWLSSNESVATIDNDGNVTVKGAGNTTITVYVIDTEISDSFVLDVKMQWKGINWSVSNASYLVKNESGTLTFCPEIQNGIDIKFLADANFEAVMKIDFATEVQNLQAGIGIQTAENKTLNFTKEANGMLSSYGDFIAGGVGSTKVDGMGNILFMKYMKYDTQIIVSYSFDGNDYVKFFEFAMTEDQKNIPVELRIYMFANWSTQTGTAEILDFVYNNNPEEPFNPNKIFGRTWSTVGNATLNEERTQMTVSAKGADGNFSNAFTTIITDSSFEITMRLDFITPQIGTNAMAGAMITVPNGANFSFYRDSNNNIMAAGSNPDYVATAKGVNLGDHQNDTYVYLRMLYIYDQITCYYSVDNQQSWIIVQEPQMINHAVLGQPLTLYLYTATWSGDPEFTTTAKFSDFVYTKRDDNYDPNTANVSGLKFSLTGNVQTTENSLTVTAKGAEGAMANYAAFKVTDAGFDFIVKMNYKFTDTDAQAGIALIAHDGNQFTIYRNKYNNLMVQGGNSFVSTVDGVALDSEFGDDVWIRVTVIEDQITVYYSDNGQTWNLVKGGAQLESHTINPDYVGKPIRLALYNAANNANDASFTSTAVFDNIQYAAI